MQPHLLPPGFVIAGDFVVVRPLDKGGMGAVYVVRQQSTEKLRALKVMHPEIAADTSLERRFEQEARVGARIDSEHVVEVIAAGKDDALGAPYLVMELLEGEDLRRHLQSRGAMSLLEVCEVFEQLCHAMAAAHAAGVVHRDLKPENIFLARSRRAGDAPFTLKVLDFGISKLMAEAQTRATHGTIGSPLWMAPEQTTEGPVTPGADIWALGLIAYHLLTGGYFWRTAQGGTAIQLLREIVMEPIAQASVRAREEGLDGRLPPGFDGWFARCVVREPTARFPSVKALWGALESLLGASDAFADTAAPPQPAPVLDRPQATPLSVARDAPMVVTSKRGPSAVVLGSALAIAAAGAAGGWFLLHRPARDLAPASLGSLDAAPPAAPPPPAAAAELATPPSAAGVTATPVPPVSEVPRDAAVHEAPAKSAAPRPAAATPKSAAQESKDGFADPIGLGLNGTPAVVVKVQDRHVRLFTRIVKNDSNVADAVIRKAIDHYPWGYAYCYQRAFGGAKELPNGVVTVGFDILQQLPRYGALQSSTIDNETLTSCVVYTLVGQTINAAGWEGKGHVVYAFRFQTMD